MILTLDGGGELVMERMLAKGVMPNLAALKARGVYADYSRTNYPSKTASGHAALWTGAYANVNGITSNKTLALPLNTHSILDLTDGFSAEALLAEPLYVTAARAGRRVQVLQATHMSPFAIYAPGGRFGGPYRGSLALLNGYEGVEGEEGVFTDTAAFQPAKGWKALPASAAPPREARLPVAKGAVIALAYDDPQDPVTGYDTLALHAERDAAPLATLKPTPERGWSPALPIGAGSGAKSYFRLFTLDPALKEVMIYHSAPSRPEGNRPEVVEATYQDRTFLTGGANKAWYAGKLGKTMFEGGDGQAEARYLDTVRHHLAETKKNIRQVMARGDWELFFNYLPFPDEALHAWYGAVDTQSPSHSPAHEAVVWENLEKVCALVDDYLGFVVETAGPHAVIAVASDHGMAGLKYTFYPNQVLQQAGLLTADAQGKIDLSRTKIVYSPANGTFFTVNRASRRGGIVAERDVPAVIAAAEAALKRVKAKNGQPLVTQFLRPDAETAELGLGGVRGGDLYIDVQPGYYLHESAKPETQFKELRVGSASHMFDSRRPDMHAIMLLAGPGLKQGVEIGAVRNIDLAPTVSHLLGMPAPAQARGRVLEEALAP